MTRQQAIELLQAEPSANVRFQELDATRSHWLDRRAWLDEEGELFYEHPTDPHGGRCLAPHNVDYYERDRSDDD